MKCWSIFKLTIWITAYALYFDHKRRTDPNFRKQLKKESKRQARAAKEEAEAHTIRQREVIRTAVQEAKEEGFPTDVEEKEAYFMQEVAQGEGLSQDGMFGAQRSDSKCSPTHILPREQQHRGCSLILQSSEGLSTTFRIDKHL